jgi:hypothetical protein
MSHQTGVAGKVVVIAGASSGIGEATARHLAARGAMVVLGARRKDRLDAVVKDILSRDGKAAGFATDVTKRGDVEARPYSRTEGSCGLSRILRTLTMRCSLPRSSMWRAKRRFSAVIESGVLLKSSSVPATLATSLMKIDVTPASRRRTVRAVRSGLARCGSKTLVSVTTSLLDLVLMPSLGL